MCLVIMITPRNNYCFSLSEVNTVKHLEDWKPIVVSMAYIRYVNLIYIDFLYP